MKFLGPLGFGQVYFGISQNRASLMWLWIMRLRWVHSGCVIEHGHMGQFSKTNSSIVNLQGVKM